MTIKYRTKPQNDRLFGLSFFSNPPLFNKKYRNSNPTPILLNSNYKKIKSKRNPFYKTKEVEKLKYLIEDKGLSILNMNVCNRPRPVRSFNKRLKRIKLF